MPASQTIPIHQLDLNIFMESHMSRASHLSRPLAAAISTALFAALLVPGSALSQTAKEQELEARIQQLERQLQQLLGQQQQQQNAISQTQSQLDQVRVTQASVPAGQKPIQSTTILPGAPAGSKFTVGGMVRMDAMWTETSDGFIGKGNSGRDFYLPVTTPVSPQGIPGTSHGYFDAHAKFSRLWFDATTILDGGGKLGARIEVDFAGGNQLGNTRATNTYGTTIRHAYITYNNWLVGQTFSNFMDVAALVDSVDFVGPMDAVTFSRQPQVRYTHGGWTVSLENPETTVNTFGNGIGYNTIPDLIGRYTHRAGWGHVSFGGIVRQLKARSNDPTETGYGLTLSGLVKLGSSTDFRYQVNAGDGIGRYIGLSAVAPDAYLKNNELEALGVWAAYAGVRHVINPNLRGNLYYATSHWDNDNDAAFTGFTKKVQSWHANLIWSPVPKLDFGVEASWGERTLESGRDGEIVRLQTMARYSF